MSGYLYNIVNILKVNILTPSKYGEFVSTNINNLTEVFYGSFNVVKSYLYADGGSNDIVNVELTGLPANVPSIPITATINTATSPPIFYLTNRFVDMDDDDYDAIDILIDGDDERASTVKTKFDGSIIKLEIYNNFNLSTEDKKTIIYNLVENVKDLPSTSIKKEAINEVTTLLTSSSTSSASTAVSLPNQLDALSVVIYNTFVAMAQIEGKPTTAKENDIKKDIKNTIIKFISYTNTYLGPDTNTNTIAITNVVNELNTYYTNNTSIIPKPHPNNVPEYNNGHDDDDTFVDIQFKLKDSIIDLGIHVTGTQRSGDDVLFYFKKLNNDSREVLKNKRCIHLMQTLFNTYYPSSSSSSTPSTEGNVVFNRFIFGMFIKDFLINNTAQKTHRIAIEYTTTPPNSNINVYLVLSIATAHSNQPKSRVSEANRNTFFSSTPTIVGDAIFSYSDNSNKNSNIDIVNGSNNHSYVSICNNAIGYQANLITLTTSFKTKPYTDLANDASIIDRYISICDKYHDIMTVDNKSTTLVNICSNYLNKIMTLYSNKMIGILTGRPQLQTFIRDIMNKYTTNNNKSKFDKFEPLMVRFVLNWYKSKIPSKNINLSLTTEASDINGGKKLVRYLLDKDETLNPTFINSDDNLPKIADDTNHYVFNFDIMQPTSKIKHCYNNNEVPATRKYLNSPEVIDGGHQYAFPEPPASINIEFPTNYKVSHFPLNPDTTFDIHSFSQTNKIGLVEVYYIITIYFSITITSGTQYLDFSVIHYINIVNAPSKNEIYDELNTANNTKQITKMIANINARLTTTTPLITEENRNNVKWAILDCILHGKSTQDEQNMLQVNERSVNDTIGPLNKPTNFIGICFDFMSTANGINLRYNPGIVDADPKVKNTGVIGYYKHNKSTNNQFVGIIGDEFYIINHTYADGDFVNKCNNYFGAISASSASAGATLPTSGGSMIGGGGTFNVKEKNDGLLLTWCNESIKKEDYTKALFFNSILTKSDDPNSMEIFKQMETYINPNEDDLIYLFDWMFKNDNDNILNFTKSIGRCNNTRIKGYTIMSNHYLSVLLSCLEANGRNIVDEMDVEGDIKETVVNVIKRVNDFFELNYVISDNIMIINNSLQLDKETLITQIMDIVVTYKQKNIVSSESRVVNYEDTETADLTKKPLSRQVTMDYESDTNLVTPSKKIRTEGGKRFTRRVNKNNNVGKYTRRKRNGKNVNNRQKTKRINK